VVQRKYFGIIPIVVMVACGGTSKSNRPGGSGAASGTGDTGGTGGVTGGSGGSKAGGGGRGGSNPAGGRGGTGDVGGSGGSGAIAGSDSQGGSSYAGAGGTSGSGGQYCGREGCVEPIDPPGPIYCGGVECAAEHACCTATGDCFDPQQDPEACPAPPQDGDPAGRKPCTSNSHCAEGEFCMMDTLTCLGSGHCQPRWNCGGCGGECEICGCDGNTYPNQQTACLAGANVVGPGACGVATPIDGAGGGAGAGGSAGAGGGGPRVRIPCAYSDQCPSDQVCCPRFGECTIDDPYLCGEPPPGTRKPCNTNDQCQSYEYCIGEGCEGPGGCVTIGSQGECGVRLEPVCGCNGVSYTSAACASTEGVRVASPGQCPAAAQ
jgi:hypothetical protein